MTNPSSKLDAMRTLAPALVIACAALLAVTPDAELAPPDLTPPDAPE